MKKKRETSVQIGERIRTAREAAHYTQQELAETIDVSSQYVSDLERGVVGASLNTISKICSALSVSADYLLFGSGFEQADKVKYITNRLQSLSTEELDIVNSGLDVIIKAFQTRK